MTAADPAEGRVLLVRRGPVADLVLDRPAKRNALTEPMLRQLAGLLRDLADDDEVRVVTLRGAGDRAFSAGADLRAFAEVRPPRLWRRWTRLGQETFAALAHLPQVTVAVLNGPAIGGGLELAVHCDLRVAGSAVRVGLPEVTLGTLPGWSGLARIAELTGPSRARLLALTGRLITAEQAGSWGLVDVVADPVTEAADALVGDLLRGGPVAQRLLKARLAGPWRAWSDPQALLDSLGGAVAAAEGESAEGVAALLGGRPAAWSPGTSAPAP